MLRSVCGQVELRHGNVLEEEFEDAPAIFMYLLPAGMRLLKDRLTTLLDNGCRIVSYGKHLGFLWCATLRCVTGAGAVFSIPDVEPKEVRVYKSTKLYYYSRSKETK